MKCVTRIGRESIPRPVVGNVKCVERIGHESIPRPVVAIYIPCHPLNIPPVNRPNRYYATIFWHEFISMEKVCTYCANRQISYLPCYFSLYKYFKYVLCNTYLARAFRWIDR